MHVSFHQTLCEHLYLNHVCVLLCFVIITANTDFQQACETQCQSPVIWNIYAGAYRNA